MKHLITVVDSCFDYSVSAGGQMQFPSQATSITGVRKKSADEFFIGWHRLAILAALGCTGISTGQECRPTRCADRALRIRLCKSHPFANQLVNARRIDVRITKRSDGVEPLLVRANPEDIRG